MVVAMEQTEGRGRHGNAWASPLGGIYMSYVPPREMMPARPTDLSVMASLAVADCVEGTLDNAGVLEPRALLKWPNDVLLSDGKVAGILVQSRDLPLAVVGIGLNVNTSVAPDGYGFSGDPTFPPRSLGEVAGHPLDLSDVTVDLAGRLAQRLPSGLDGEAVEEYRSRCHTLGRQVSFTVGGDAMVGTAIDIDAEGGGLLVRLDGGETIHVTSGEVGHVRSVEE
jgi:BirA family biotin operon repressor/biotin-[acetyl-CoA-carboxylase] ligase